MKLVAAVPRGVSEVFSKLETKVAFYTSQVSYYDASLVPPFPDHYGCGRIEPEQYVDDIVECCTQRLNNRSRRVRDNFRVALLQEGEVAFFVGTGDLQLLSLEVPSVDE